ncbi:MAG: TolC family protein [Prevotella sp.]|nr:TolC family protein [Prevotella sp.]
MKYRSVALLMVVIGAMPMKAQEKRTITVGQLFELVESNSKTLQTQKTSVEFASKGIEAAKSQRLPDINTSLSVSYNGNVLITDRHFGDANGYSVPHFGNSFALEAQQVVYAGGAIDAGIRMAMLQKEQAIASEQQTREQQRFLVLAQYLDLFKIGNRMQVYEKNIELTAHLIEDIKAKHEEGMALRNDVTRYELQMEDLRLGLRKLQDQRAILNYQLCNTLGLAQETEIVPAVEYDTTNTSLSNWQSEALSNSPLLQQTQIGKQMATEGLRLAKSEMLPKIALVAADNLSGPFSYDIPPKDINYNYWFVGIGVKYSLSSLFKSNKKIQQARINTRQTDEAHAVAQEQLSDQVQQAYTLYQQAFAELDTQQKSVQLARQNYEVVNSRYLAQLALITDMLDASNIKLNAELQEVDARTNIVYNYYKMKFITGTL